MELYDHKKIEPKWQKTWEKSGLYHAKETKKPKKYVLIEFPYPSGEGLHMGHLRPFIAGDVYSRFNRLSGFETLYPIGWDAFGLPAENYAIKNKVHPSISTAKNIANAKRQLMSWGTSFDWSREINTTDPEYYKWTQWLFLQFYKKGLAYEATGLINWCPKDKTGLANEEVVDGCCERCGTPVEKKELRQWYLKITDYAEKLLEGLKTLNWPEPVKIQQENWIGKSEGAEIEFEIEGSNSKIKVFTTRPDTLFGATYMVLAPEHPLVEQITTEQQKGMVEKYVNETKNKSELQRSALEKEKTGVFTGAFAINPATKEKIPVWIADYVLGNYGTGAIMAVPAHDERDMEFAKKYKLPIKTVINEQGKLIDSAQYNDLDWQEAKKKITKDFGTSKVQYKLRDWVFSRQRYWGEPIPLIHCDKCGIVAVPDDQLPVKLPDVKDYEPTGTGESPLAAIDSWVNVKCPNCDGAAKRETNTMPQWAGSSWYWLRYTDPTNDKKFADKKKLKYWTPVDVYFGGMEHTTLHLLYSRFWNLFLYDQKLVTTKEAYARRVPHGIVLASDGEKMSKSRGNVVNPDVIVDQYGADTLRMYELFLGPHDTSVSWNDQGIMGVKRFLDKVWRYNQVFEAGEENKEIHKLIKKISTDIEQFKFNTAIAAFMEFLNENKQLSQANWESFLILLAPFAPHITEELWHQLKHKDSIHEQAWPKFDEKQVVNNTSTIVIQVLGKIRATLEFPLHATQEEVKEKAMQDENVKKYLEGKEIIKEIFVKDRLINFVVK
ncbi:MAG TPA: leucine--tRNA ligase [Methylomirabilota bacterium]|nr:leucine--tRNA ligase [Methylomirabilota bacterium]